MVAVHGKVPDSPFHMRLLERPMRLGGSGSGLRTGISQKPQQILCELQSVDGLSVEELREE